MNSLLADLRYGLRTLLRTPGFAIAAISALALGIGANVAVFSAVDAMLLRPLQFRDADRLAVVWEDARSIGFPQDTPAAGNFADWKARNHVFEELGALQSNIYAITGDGPPEQVEGNPVTANLFPLLGVAPMLGRNFLPEEDRPQGPKVAIIGFGLWQRRYGADRSVIGRGILLDGETYRIVGVMPRGLIFPDRSDIWVPIAFRADQLIARGSHYLQVYGRLKPGVTLESAQRDMSAIAAQLAREYPETNTNVGAVVAGLRDQWLGDTRLGLWALACGVGCVLLIACANVAGLLLARAVGREREIAVRAALGAGRLRLIQQSMVETLILAAAGGAAGLLIAAWTIPFLDRLVPQTMAGWSQPQLDWRMLLFTFLISTASAVGFGVLPSVSLSGVDLGAALQSGGRGGIGGRAKLRSALVVSEVAIAVVLCVAAGLLIETLRHLEHVELGFRPEGVLTVRTSLPISPESQYRNFPARAAFFQGVLERVQALPGVVSAGYTTFLPLTNGGGTSGFTVEGAPPLALGQLNDANHRAVSAAYLQTMGVRLRAGRYFTDSDGPDSLPAAIINAAVARQYWPNVDPIGHRFKLGRTGSWITIVGIVENVRQEGIDLDGRAEMYFPLAQPTGNYGYFTPRDLALRVQGDPLRYAQAVRQAVWTVDHNQPVSAVQPMTQLVAEKLAVRQLEMQLLSAFASLALLLAALGLYGLLTYTVSRRVREIGVRMALGAQPGQILQTILSEGLRLVLAGLILGSTAGWAVTGMIRRLLYGVRPADPSAFGATALVLMATCLLACYLPARRAAATSPNIALRDE